MWRLIGTAAVLVVLSLPQQDAVAVDRRFEPMRLKSGLVLPYPLHQVFRGWARCKRGRHTHRAIDIGGIGDDWGIGTPIRAIARGKVIHLGRPEDDPKRYGIRDTGPGEVKRGKSMLPKERDIEGYGTVRFFTKNHGRFRTGVLIVTKITAGRLNGYTVKYMHLAAPHPDLKRGSVVEAGQEIGLMGGTAVQRDPPHLHLAILNRAGKPVDPGPLLGIGSTRWRCRGGKKADWAARSRVRKKAITLMRDFERRRARVQEIGVRPAECGLWRHEGTFDDKKVRVHRVRALTGESEAPITVRLEVTDGKWRPRLALFSDLLTPLYDGRRARKKAGRKVKARKIIDGRKRKATAAAFSWHPGAGEFMVHVRSWGKRPPVGATYTLEIERKCPDVTVTP